ncbi:hypothetical protein [Streptobacillus moniliformis]|uniref:hypothetical protein n=1 Tax=Streptobacillus moniliformis TaxID=34105 RepID=UPI0007E3926C|nr:hypothetical protein [Streptobacillus moniliformis]
MKKIKLKKEIFLQGIELLEIVLSKKFEQKQLTAYYHLLNDLIDEEYMKGIEEYLKNNTYSKLPLPGEIRKFTETDRKFKEERDYYEVCQFIKIMTKNTTKAYVCENPIVHIIVDKLGGLHKLGYMESEKLEILLSTKVRAMITAYSSIKNEVVPLMIGNINSKHIIEIGNKEKIKAWTNAYKERLELKNG